MSDSYVIDYTSLSYMLENFPKKLYESIWGRFVEYCRIEKIISERETQKKLEVQLEEQESIDWINKHKNIFKSINQKEAEKLGDMIEKGEFEFYYKSNEFKRRLPISLPFLIAIAKNQNRTLVINKNSKERKKILEICKREHIVCIETEDLLLNIKNDISN